MVTSTPAPGPRSSSPRSSITFIPSRPTSSGRPNESNVVEGSVNSPVFEEAEWIEHEIVRYGGDELEDPPIKGHSESPSHPTKDPNMVDWDGPNDPENPQNWSVRFKWMMTIVVIIMTVNVYVFIPNSWPD